MKLKIVGHVRNFELRRWLHRTTSPTAYLLPAIELDMFIKNSNKNAGQSVPVSFDISQKILFPHQKLLTSAIIERERVYLGFVK